MKKTKLFISVFIMLAVGMFSGIVCHADMVDDICEEFGYNYRWTVEVELDDTWRETGLYEISDNGRLQISQISFEKPVLVIGAERSIHIPDCYVLSGKTELACEKSATPYGGFDTAALLDVDYALVKDGEEWRRIGLWEEEHPLHYLYEEYGNINFVANYMRYKDDFTQACLIISEDGEPDGSVTPIYIDDALFREIEDSEILYFNRRVAFFPYRSKKPPTVRKSLPVKAIVREDRKTPPVPDEINIAEIKAELNHEDVKVDFDYDKDIIFGKQTNNTYTAWENSKKSNEIFIINGGGVYSYRISNYEGETAFDIELPIDNFSDKMQEIAPDGKVNILIKQYNVAFFDREEPDKGPSMWYNYIVTFKGSGGVGYGLICSSAVSTADGDMCYHILTMADDFDGSEGLAKKSNYSKREVIGGQTTAFDYPEIYLKYNKESGAISEIGVGYVKELVENSGDYYESYTLPIENAYIDECVELEFTKTNLYNSEYLAKPVVEKARAERGATDTANTEPVASPEPTSTPEPTTTPEPTETAEPKKDGISIIINGEELVLDVEPQISGDRVLVPLRAIFEKLGAEVEWNEETGTVAITKDETVIEFLIDDTAVKVNDGEKQMDVPAQIVNERALVPMRFLAIELGYDVDWDAKNQDVLINAK